MRAPIFGRMGTPAGAPIVDWSSKTVAISDPSASRSDTRTVVGALTPVCNPACRPNWPNFAPGDTMQINGGDILVGVDVSKAWIDVCLSGSRHVERIANTPEGLAAWVAQARPTLVAMEPTGGCERALCWALAEAGVRYVKIHPNTILAFRKARGLRAKTDRIDAMLIAQCLAEATARRRCSASRVAAERSAWVRRLSFIQAVCMLATSQPQRTHGGHDADRRPCAGTHPLPGRRAAGTAADRRSCSCTACWSTASSGRGSPTRSPPRGSARTRPTCRWARTRSPLEPDADLSPRGVARLILDFLERARPHRRDAGRQRHRRRAVPVRHRHRRLADRAPRADQLRRLRPVPAAAVRTAGRRPAAAGRGIRGSWRPMRPTAAAPLALGFGPLVRDARPRPDPPLDHAGAHRRRGPPRRRAVHARRSTQRTCSTSRPGSPGSPSRSCCCGATPTGSSPSTSPAACRTPSRTRGSWRSTAAAPSCRSTSPPRWPPRSPPRSRPPPSTELIRRGLNPARNGNSRPNGVVSLPDRPRR